MAELTPELRSVKWGFMLGDRFIELPKLPMLRAGFDKPPFSVTMPGCTVRDVVERPCEPGEESKF